MIPQAHLEAYSARSVMPSGGHLDDGNGKTGGIGSLVVVNNNAKHRQDAEGENRLIVDDHVKTPRSISRRPPSRDWMG